MLVIAHLVIGWVSFVIALDLASIGGETNKGVLSLTSW
jgi:hypothetical protein